MPCSARIVLAWADPCYRISLPGISYGAVRTFLTCLLAFASLHAEEPSLLSSEVTLGLGPCHDAAWVDGLLVVVGDGALTTWSAPSGSATPRALGRLTGLGAVRQVVVQQGLAYVAAREDGLAVVDLRDPAQPRLLARFDTHGKATGLAVAGNLCFIACTYFGVQIIDIGDPARPRHLATALAKLECQSVAWHDGHLYAGVWADRLVVIADVRDPCRPREVARCQLDGYGDGVAVSDGVLYAATGHHAASFRGLHFELARQNEPGWGQGHGLELWDVRDPAQPSRLSVCKTATFYLGIPDMWSVEVHGDRALLTDTANGVSLIDIADPRQPRELARAELPGRAPAGGCALGPGMLFVAGWSSDLHLVPLPGVDPVERPVPPPTPIDLEPLPAIAELDGWLIVRPGGQMREACRLDDGRLALAAGDAGLHLLSLDGTPRLQPGPALRGPARSVAACGTLLAVAEGLGGLSTWRLANDGTWQALGRWQDGTKPVLQVVLPPPGRWAVIENGIHHITLIDLADPALPRLVESWQGPGIVYGAQIASAPVAGRWLAWWLHTGGPYFLDLQAPGHPAPARPVAGNLHSGVTGCAADGDHLLVLARDGLQRIDPIEPREIKELPLARLIDNRFGHRSMNGQATAEGDLLLVANAAWSMLRVVDIRDRTAPVLRQVFITPGNPHRPLVADGRVIVPDGFAGVRLAPLARLTSP